MTDKPEIATRLQAGWQYLIVSYIPHDGYIKPVSILGMYSGFEDDLLCFIDTKSTSYNDDLEIKIQPWLVKEKRVELFLYLPLQCTCYPPSPFSDN